VTVSKDGARYQPVAWWFTKRRLGRELRNLYHVAEELPPQLPALIGRLEGKPTQVRGARMSDLERLLAPGCIELPACRCGEEMHLDHTAPLPERPDTHIRVYKCPACHHEMRLTVWGVDDDASSRRVNAGKA
jgi:hypothetical protein